MGRCKLSKALFAGALALAASGAVHARSIVYMSDARDHMSFSDATFDTSSNGVFGDLPHATLPFGVTTAAVNGGSVLGWDLDAKTKLNPDAHRQEDGMTNMMKFHGRRRHDVSPVTAIPEPSTYALLAAGLAGIAIVTRRRRGGSR